MAERGNDTRCYEERRQSRKNWARRHVGGSADYSSDEDERSKREGGAARQVGAREMEERVNG